MSGPHANMSSGELTIRLRQQHLVADFGLFALGSGSLANLLDRCSRVAAEGLQTRLSKVLEYRPIINDFLVVAGVGWHAGIVGHSTLGSGLDSPAGFTMHTGQPTLSNHLAQEQRFRVPALLAEHGVQSAINVVIASEAGIYGVLEVDSGERDEFVGADTAFLQALANVLAAGLERSQAETAKDTLLREKDLLMREVHHRVTNSLQLVRTMLALQARSASDDTKLQLDVAANRIMSIAAVHRHLYHGGSVFEGNASAYLTALVEDMRAMLADASASRTIVMDVEPVMLPADSLTPLGLVVTELVTNAIKYGAGQVTVRVYRVPLGLEIAVEDEGPGFGPDFQPTKLSGLGMRLIASLAKGTPAQAIRVDPAASRSRIMVTLKL